MIICFKCNAERDVRFLPDAFWATKSGEIAVDIPGMFSFKFSKMRALL